MKWRILMRAESPEAVKAALRKARINFAVDAVRLDGAAKLGPQRDPKIAKAIYDMVKDGLSFRIVGDRFGVSLWTVMRVAHDPRKYGIDEEPIRRRS